MTSRTESTASSRVKILLVAVLLAVIGLIPGRVLAQSLALQQQIIQPVYGPNAVAYSPNGKLLAVSGLIGTKIYTLATGAVVSVNGAGGGYAKVQFSPNSRTLVIGLEGYIQFFDVLTGKQVKAMNFQAYPAAGFAFSPNGTQFAVGGESATGPFLQLYSATSYQLLHSFNTSNVHIQNVAFAPNGEYVADASASSGEVELWNVSTHKLKATLQGASTSGVFAIAFSPNSEVLAVVGSGDPGPVVELWNVPTGKLKTTLKTGCAYQVTDVAFSPDGLNVIDCGSGSSLGGPGIYGLVEVWKVATGRIEADLVSPIQYGGPALAISPDGKSLAHVGTSGSSAAISNLLEIWNLVTGKLTEQLDTSSPFAFPAAAYSPNGKAIAAGYGVTTANGKRLALGLWDTTSGQMIRSFPSAATSSITSVAYSPDGSLVADGGYSETTSTSEPGVVEIWNVSTGNPATRLTTSAGLQVASVAFSPDGQTFAAGGISAGNAGVVDIWSVTTGQRLLTIQVTSSGSVQQIAFSPDSKTLAIAGNGNVPNEPSPIVGLWDVASGTMIKRLLVTPDYTVTAVAFSPDGKTLADSSYNLQTVNGFTTANSVVEVWDVATGDNIADPAIEFGQQVSSVKFSPDGKVLFAVAGSLFGFSTAGYTPILYDVDFQSESVAVSPLGNQLGLTGPIGSLILVANQVEGAVPISSITINPVSVVAGALATGTLTLSAPAPATGLVI